MNIGLGLILLLSAIAIALSLFIDTFDEKEFSIWLPFGLPITMAAFLFLFYRGWKRNYPKAITARFWVGAGITAAFGFLASFLFVLAPELANAAWRGRIVEEEVVVAEKHGQKGSVRRSDHHSVRFASREGKGGFSTSVSGSDFNRVAVGGAYRIRYRVGLFGWKYKIGNLDILELKSPEPSFETGKAATDSVLLRMQRMDSILKARLRGEAGE